MHVQHRALSVALLVACVLPAFAGPPANSGFGFIASKAGEQVQIEGNENSPVVISQLSVTCPFDGWLVVRAHAQFSISDNGDGATALILGITLDHPQFFAVFSSATQARSAWEIGSQILPVLHIPTGGERIDPCRKGQKSTYYFIGSQNNIGDETIAENITLVAEFFRDHQQREDRGPE